MSGRLSIVIPTLNEAQFLPRCLADLRQNWPEAQVVVADGASTDPTPALARAAGAQVLSDLPRSRGTQCQAGAAAATGEWLLFLHADSMIDSTAAAAVDYYQQRGEPHRLAQFRIRFDAPTALLKFSAWCTRFDSVFTRFGDQGILIHRDYYEALGGFPSWPLFEDVDLLRRARRRHPIDVLPANLVTSARRFHQRGEYRQQLSNGWLLVRFLLGADPHQLVRRYSPVEAGADRP